MPDQSDELSRTPNEGDSTQGDSITVADAIRLKHRLNTSIPWGNSNLNALEVEGLTRLKAEDYARALQAAGTPTILRRFPGFIHAFIAAAGVSRVCRDALVEIGGATRAMFAAHART